MRCSPVPLLAVVVLTVSLGAGAEARTVEKAPPRVVVVLDPFGCPGVSTLRVCEGFATASRSTGVSGRMVAPTPREDLSAFLGLVARQPYAAIITWSVHYDPALKTVADRYPDRRFVVMDASRDEVRGRPRNVQGVVFRASEAAYLAGWLAGTLERRRPGHDVVGVVAGVKIPAVDDFVVGFEAGARRATPGIRVLVDYSGDFADESRCAAIARRQVARGAGALFNVAGGCGLGTMGAAADAGVWAIGVDSDQSFLGPHVLTSVLKRFDAGFLAVLRQVKTGRVITGRDTVLGLRDRAVGLGKISPRVPRALVARLEELRRGIVAGDIRVPSVYARRTR